MIVRVPCGNPEWRQGIVLGFRIVEGLTRNVGRLRAARCLRIVKNSSASDKETYSFLQMLNLSHTTDLDS